MKVSTEPMPDSQLLLQVETEAQEMEKPLEAAYRRLARRVSFPGFRPGKAPRSMVERYLGREALVDEALGETVAWAYEQALKEKDIQPVAYPQIEVLKKDPLSFKAVLSLAPKVELGDYQALRLPLEVPQVGEEDVEMALERLREQKSPWEPVERPVAQGDLVTVTVVGRLANKVVINEKALEMAVDPAGNLPLPGFAENLLAVGKGEEREFSLPISVDHPNPRLRGQEVSFRVKVLEVKQRQLLPLEELVKESGFADLASLKESLSSGLQAGAKARAREALEDKATEALVAGAQVEFPPALVEQQVDRLLERQGTKEVPEKAREELRPIAAQQVVRNLVLTKLSEAEKIEVSEEEIEAEGDRAAGGRAEVKRFFSSLAPRQALKEVLVMRKTRERLVDIVTGEREGK
jgi:trigger factor